MKIEMKILDDRLNDIGYATPGAAAMDLRACSVEGSIVIRPGERTKIGTGVAVDLGSVRFDGDFVPSGGGYAMENFYGFHAYSALVLPRSGLGSKGIVLSNLVGLIDEDYQGEVLLSVWNAGDAPFEIHALDRLAQLMIVPAVRPSFDIVSDFTRKTARGTGGFGSTGTK